MSKKKLYILLSISFVIIIAIAGVSSKISQKNEIERRQNEVLFHSDKPFDRLVIPETDKIEEASFTYDTSFSEAKNNYYYSIINCFHYRYLEEQFIIDMKNKFGNDYYKNFDYKQNYDNEVYDLIDKYYTNYGFASRAFDYRGFDEDEFELLMYEWEEDSTTLREALNKALAAWDECNMDLKKFDAPILTTYDSEFEAYQANKKREKEKEAWDNIPILEKQNMIKEYYDEDIANILLEVKAVLNETGNGDNVPKGKFFFNENKSIIFRLYSDSDTKYLFINAFNYYSSMEDYRQARGNIIIRVNDADDVKSQTFDIDFKQNGKTISFYKTPGKINLKGENIESLNFTPYWILDKFDITLGD